MNLDSHLVIIAYVKKLQCYIGDSFPNLALLHFCSSWTSHAVLWTHLWQTIRRMADQFRPMPAVVASSCLLKLQDPNDRKSEEDPMRETTFFCLSRATSPDGTRYGIGGTVTISE